MSHAQDKMKEIKVDEEPLDLESLQVQYNEKELEKASFKEKYAMTKQIETQINEYKKIYIRWNYNIRIYLIRGTKMNNL